MPTSLTITKPLAYRTETAQHQYAHKFHHPNKPFLPTYPNLKRLLRADYSLIRKNGTTKFMPVISALLDEYSETVLLRHIGFPQDWEAKMNR